MNPQTSSDPTPPEPQGAWSEGWHDSSLDLKRGLVVTEHGALDELVDGFEPGAASSAKWPAESLTRWIRPRA